MKFWPLLALLCLPGTVFSHEFNYENLLMAHVALNPNYDYASHVDSYMKRFRKDVWEQYRNDEFELNDKRQESLELWKTKVSGFDLSEEFVLRTSFEFESYDFERRSFPLDGMSQGSNFYQSTYWPHTFPRRIKVFFQNPGIVKDLEMPKDQAHDFLKARKDRHGDVDRKLVAEIRFLPVKLKADGDIVAELQSVTLYSDSRMTRELMTFRK